MTVPLKRRMPVVRRMRFMQYPASKDLPPATEVTFNRSWRTRRPIGLHLRWGMSCYSWIWRTVR
jgi:hypothetical protein